MSRIYCILFVGLLVVQACGGLKRIEKKPQLTTTPERLELAVNTKADPYVIPVNYTLNVPRGYLPSCSRLVYSPRLIAQGHEYQLTPIVITGKNFNRLEERQQLLDDKQPGYPNAMHLVASGDSMQIRMSELVPFEMWMPQAKLQANVMLDACDRQTLLYTQDLANGVLYIPVMPGPALVKYVQKEVEKKAEGFARFYYPVNGYTVDPALYSNRSQLDSMTVLMHRVLNDTNIHVNRIVITGICSPDGAWGYNEGLAKRRAEFISNYLINHERISSDLIETKYIAEDWEGLKKLISESTMSNKEALLNTIDEISNPDQREAALRKFPQFNYIKQNFYPQLRKVTYEIYYTTKEMVQEVVPE